MKNPAGGFIDRRIRAPLTAQLTLGLTPDRLALALALGAALSVFPLFGTTTILCAITALLLRLNQPAIQLANYLAYPLQLLLYVPFFRAGAWLFGQMPFSLSLGEIRLRLSQDFWGTLGVLWGANLHAMVVWAVLAPWSVAGLYWTFKPLVRRLTPGRMYPSK